MALFPEYVTFGKIAKNDYGDNLPCENESETRDEIGWYYFLSREMEWFKAFQELDRSEPDDIIQGIQGNNGDITVKEFVKARVAKERDRINAMSVDEWWAFEFRVVNDHPELAGAADMEQPPRPPTWLDPEEELEAKTCDMCGTRFHLFTHYSGMRLCHNCADTNWGRG